MIEKVRSYLLKNANQNNPDSVSDSSRKKRLSFFKEFCEPIKKPVNILDVGGSDYHWRNSEFANNNEYHITLLNTENQNVTDLSNFTYVNKDAGDLSAFKDDEFDVVYSNSLIEHFNTFEKQKKLAKEIIRIGKHYFVQTPNYYFPMEPHFLYPFFQMYSTEKKTKLIMNKDLGWYEKQTDFGKAKELADSIRLLKLEELKKLFPDSDIYFEKYYTLNKSFIAYK